MIAQKVEGKKLAIVPILRAGLGMVDGILTLVPVAKVGHIGLYRDPLTHNPVEYYCKLPQDIEDRYIIVCDPMLATGGSASGAISMLKDRGCTQIKLLCLVAAPEGVERLQHDHPDVQIYSAALDEKLNDHAYIVPGLGDAGDRLFGTKQYDISDIGGEMIFPAFVLFSRNNALKGEKRYARVHREQKRRGTANGQVRLKGHDRSSEIASV